MEAYQQFQELPSSTQSVIINEANVIEIRQIYEQLYCKIIKLTNAEAI
jgi:hypothetical protein